jgi:hypothetical protein
MATNNMGPRSRDVPVGAGMTVPLPKPKRVEVGRGPTLFSYTAAQLQAYGEACRKEALEEAAKVCFAAEEPDDEYVSTRHTIAKAIRSLK